MIPHLVAFGRPFLRCGPWLLGCATLIISASGWLSPAVSAGETVPAGVLSAPPDSSPSFLTNVPPQATHVAPALRQVVDVANSSLESQRKVQQLRLEQDGVKTKLATVTGELNLVGQRRQRVMDQIATMEREQQDRVTALRKELEGKLEQELAQAGQQITQELERDFGREIQAFDARHQDAIGQTLDQELQLKERELQQLTREIEAQTHELIDRLGRLDANPELSKALQQSTAQALAKRKAELEARRAQVASERDALLSKQRGAFIEQVRQRQVVERQRRLTLKEATLRSAMAELLHKTSTDDAAGMQQVRQELEAVTQRSNAVAEQQAALKARLEGLDQELAAGARRVESLEAERQTSLARLEQVFHHSNPGLDLEAIAWLGQAAQGVPAELATDLSLLQQRLTALAQQEQQLQAQQRVLRERQLALQLSREMEAQYERTRLKQQQEQDARAQKAEELLAKARESAERGKFDEALGLVAQAQATNPPQLNQITAFREELLQERERTLREAQTAQIERLFARAKAVFEQGKYEEAVELFEHVIKQEAALGASGPPAP